MRYPTNKAPWPYPPDGALTYFRDAAIPAIERRDQWQWTLRLKTSPNTPIGSINLMRNEGNNRAFWLGLPWQRQGLMSEAVDVVTAYWFNTLKFPIPRVPKAIPNIASGRISEKQGMRVSGSKNATMSPAALLPRSGKSPPKSGPGDP